jgi:hypothetical protein
VIWAKRGAGKKSEQKFAGDWLENPKKTIEMPEQVHFKCSTLEWNTFGVSVRINDVECPHL